MVVVMVEVLMEVLLLLLLLFKLKDIGFCFNVFNLLCISIIIVFDIFFISVLATSCLPMSNLCNNKPTISKY